MISWNIADNAGFVNEINYIFPNRPCSTKELNMAGFRFKNEEKELLIQIIKKSRDDAAEEAARLDAIGNMTPDGVPFSPVLKSQANRTVELIQNILDKVQGTFTSAEA